MSWKNSRHDPRLPDLFAAFALLGVVVAIVVIWSLAQHGPAGAKHANFIVPSQHVHW